MHYSAIDMFEGEPPFKWSNIYHSPACGEAAIPEMKIKGVTGVILAGGGSSRMGSDKSLLLHKGIKIIEVIYRNLADLFEEVIIVTNVPELYRFLPCRKVSDIYPGQGVMAGIHAGLVRSRESAIFVVACDMPHLNGALIRHLTTLADGVDVVMPVTVGGFEPLHAIYRKECLPHLEELLQNTEIRRVVSLFSRIRVRKVIPEEIAAFDPEFTSFDNINTPEEYSKLSKSQ